MLTRSTKQEGEELGPATTPPRQRLLTGRQCIAEAALVSARVVHMKTEAYARARQSLPPRPTLKAIGSSGWCQHPKATKDQPGPSVTAPNPPARSRRPMPCARAQRRASQPREACSDRLLASRSIGRVSWLLISFRPVTGQGLQRAGGRDHAALHAAAGGRVRGVQGWVESALRGNRNKTASASRAELKRRRVCVLLPGVQLGFTVVLLALRSYAALDATAAFTAAIEERLCECLRGARMRNTGGP